MRIRLQPGDNRPIYVQIMDEVRRGLVRGTLGPDDLLPSVRELASELRVNPRTVSQAYAELERDDEALLKFGYRLLKHVLFGELSIPERKGIWEKRFEERKEVFELRRQAEIARKQQAEDDKYKNDV